MGFLHKEGNFRTARLLYTFVVAEFQWEETLNVSLWKNWVWRGAWGFLSYFAFCVGEAEAATGVLFVISAEMKELFALIGYVWSSGTQNCLVDHQCITAFASSLKSPFAVFSAALVVITTPFSPWGEKPPSTANYKLICNMLAITYKWSWPASLALQLFKMISPFLVN